MSALAPDLLIWVLLALGAGFGALGFVGLLIFPDIKSRMFTASRATLICAGLVSLSVIVFCITALFSGLGESYAMLVYTTILLFAILAFANFFISRLILEQVPVMTTCSCPDEAAATAAPPEKPE